MPSQRAVNQYYDQSYTRWEQQHPRDRNGRFVSRNPVPSYLSNTAPIERSITFTDAQMGLIYALVCNTYIPYEDGGIGLAAEIQQIIEDYYYLRNFDESGYYHSTSTPGEAPFNTGLSIQARYGVNWANIIRRRDR